MSYDIAAKYMLHQWLFAAYISWGEHIYTIDELKGSNIGIAR